MVEHASELDDFVPLGHVDGGGQAAQVWITTLGEGIVGHQHGGAVVLQPDASPCRRVNGWLLVISF